MQEIAVSVSPSELNMFTGHAQQFTATVTGTDDTTVTWSLQEPNDKDKEVKEKDVPDKLAQHQTLSVPQSSALSANGAPPQASGDSGCAFIRPGERPAIGSASNGQAP